jgi:hypothetical protein
MHIEAHIENMPVSMEADKLLPDLGLEKVSP